MSTCFTYNPARHINCGNDHNDKCPFQDGLEKELVAFQFIDLVTTIVPQRTLRQLNATNLLARTFTGATGISLDFPEIWTTKFNM
jgi:hypothetical protein